MEADRPPPPEQAVVYRQNGRAGTGLPNPREPRPSHRTLARLFHLWGLYARMDLIWVTRDTRLFLMWYLTDAIFTVAAVTGMLLLAERFAGIGSWTRAQVIFMLGYAAAVNGLLDMGFGFNIACISRRVGRGQLDHILIQPQPVWTTLLTEGFAPISGSAALLPGLGLMVWAARTLPLHFSPGWLAMLGVSLLASAAVVLAFQFLWGSLAFWAPRGAEEINSSTMRLMTQLKSFPLDGLGPALTGGLMTVLPVSFVAWVPCRALLGVGHTGGNLWVTPLVAVLFSLLAAGAFRQGMRHYGRTGSQRYSGFGHRS